MSLTVRIDASEFVQALDLASRDVRNACRRAVDRSARTARREAIDVMARDINVSKSVFRKAVPPVKASTQTTLAADWTIDKQRVLINQTNGSILPVRNVSGLQASTFALTGGGSASLNVPKAFTIKVGGKTLVMHRVGKGRAAIRAIYAASPNTTMAQTDGAPRKVWERVAARELAVNLPIEVQQALDGRGGGSSATTDGGE